jgi:hypothetical protein
MLYIVILVVAVRPISVVKLHTVSGSRTLVCVWKISFGNKTARPKRKIYPYIIKARSL